MTRTYENGPFFPPSLWWPDGGRDLQANDAEKLLSMQHEWRGQVWLDCRPPEDSMQETAVFTASFFDISAFRTPHMQAYV